MAAASSAFVRVGELACQRHPFLRELTVRVVSCHPAAVKPSVKNKSMDPRAMYDVILSDSVLFPEGGGQPCDHGTLTRRRNAEVLSICHVQRRGDTCVLSAPAPLEVGEEVELRVDWPRRVDHMQHHSAQHLLTAVVERPEFGGLPTVSWSLTHPHCFIVLPTGTRLGAEVVAKMEEVCNAAIARGVPVRCDVYPTREAFVEAEAKKTGSAAMGAKGEENISEENGNEGGEATRSRGIPADVTGPIRIITVEDNIDACTCCGTHVTNLSQLQMLKLLHQETKGDTLKLFFITGERVREFFGHMYVREKELIKELGGVRPEDFTATVVKKGKDFSDMEKRLRSLTLDLAKLEGERLTAMAQRTGEGGGSVVVCRRDEVDADFFNVLREELAQSSPKNAGVFAWAIAGAPPAKGSRPGQFMIVGPTEAIGKLTPLVTSLLEGKGGLSKFGYRGKGNLAKWDELVKELQTMTL